MQCKLRLILCGEHRFLCEIFCVYTAPIGYNEVIWRLIPLPPVSVLHKMASLDVGIWETPFIFMVAVASCFFFLSIYLILTIYFMVNPVVLLHVRFKLNVQSPSAFSYFQHHLISFIFLLCLSWACVVSSSSGQGSPLSSIRSANGWWGWGLSSWLHGEQMLSEMLWWFPPCSHCPSSLPPCC